MTPSPDTTFIPGGADLNPDAIRAAGFAAVPLPETVGQDELRALAKLTGTATLTFWSHEYDQPPREGGTAPLEDVLPALWAVSHETALIRFDGANLYIWAQDDHDFFVLFGAPKTVATCLGAKIFDYSFDEYAAEPSFSDAHKQALRAAQARYTVSKPN